MKLVVTNRIDWLAIQHKDGWWVGTEAGVSCYGRLDLARAALTIIWQREGGMELNYQIRVFTRASINTGEHTPKLSAEEALNRYCK